MRFRDNGLSIEFPYGEAACSGGGSEVSGGRGLETILIGDGRSDRCLARSADFVFATGALRKFCEVESIVHSPFESFGDVLSVVRRWNARGREGIPRERECPLLPV